MASVNHSGQFVETNTAAADRVVFHAAAGADW